jgi:hypothetical protein
VSMLVNNIEFGTDLLRQVLRHVVEGMWVEESCDDLDACYHNQVCHIDKKGSYRVPLLNSIWIIKLMVGMKYNTLQCFSCLGMWIQLFKWFQSWVQWLT